VRPKPKKSASCGCGGYAIKRSSTSASNAEPAAARTP
jgi:hypothetical protein